MFNLTITKLNSSNTIVLTIYNPTNVIKSNNPKNKTSYLVISELKDKQNKKKRNKKKLNVKEVIYIESIISDKQLSIIQRSFIVT